MANRGVNKVILVGNLGADPDIRYIPSGDMVTTIRLATGEIWKDQDGKQQERTEWHRVVFYRRLAEVAGEFLKKGSKIYIEGNLHTQQWDKDGEKRYTTEVVAKELHLLDRASDNEGASGSGCNGRQAPAKPQQHRSASPKSSVTHGGHFRQPPVSASTQALYDPDDREDDIPF